MLPTLAVAVLATLPIRPDIRSFMSPVHDSGRDEPRPE
jgi:hypothetical protein